MTAICAALVALGGCGSSHHKARSAASKTTKTVSHPVVRIAKPLVTVREVAVGPDGPEYMRIGIYDLRRDGPYVVLDFGITCLQPSNGGCSEEFDFMLPSHTGPAVSANATRPSGLTLVDPVGEKEYLPVRDSQGRPFTSEIPPLDDSLTHLNWAVFPAPPSTVTSIDVTFPNGGPQIPDVPISASATPPTAGGNVTAAQPAPFAASLGATTTTGLTLPVLNLVQTVGNPNGSDSESATQDTITLRSDVLFHFDKSNLTAAAQTILTQLAPKIKARAIGRVKVTGYTDSIGTDAVNVPLSQARAHSVVAALQPLTAGVSYQSAGMGSADPVAPNTLPSGSDNPAGRALNRRVTIVFAVKAPSPPSPPPAPPPTVSGGTTASSGAMTFVVNSGGQTTRYRTTANDLFRDGNLLVLRMTLDCLSVQGEFANNTCNDETELEGSNTAPPDPESAFSNEYNSLSAFYLLDPATGTEYVPLHDSADTPLTSGVDSNVHVGVNYPEWIYFPAPPSTVSDLTLVAPGGSPSVAGISVSPSPPQSG